MVVELWYALVHITNTTQLSISATKQGLCSGAQNLLISN